MAPAARLRLTPSPWVAILLIHLSLLAGCRGTPPAELGGFALDMSQEQVMAQARDVGGFTCNLVGTRPRLTTCQGTADQGEAYVVVRENRTVIVGLRRDPPGRRPHREMRRFVRKFGDPAWRERPYPDRLQPGHAYHTLWLDRDSTRYLAMICTAPRLTPPCWIELARTSPPAVQAKLDSILGIRRDAGVAGTR